jgi:hypothetical protein
VVILTFQPGYIWPNLLSTERRATISMSFKLVLKRGVIGSTIGASSAGQSVSILL